MDVDSLVIRGVVLEGTEEMTSPCQQESFKGVEESDLL